MDGLHLKITLAEQAIERSVDCIHRYAGASGDPARVRLK